MYLTYTLYFDISKLTRTHPQSTLGWWESRHYRCWPLGSHISLLCSYNRKQQVLRGGLCWVSGQQSRSSWRCRRCVPFWCQLCRVLGGTTQQFNHVLMHCFFVFTILGNHKQAFLWLTSANRHGRPVSCVLALYVSLTIQNIVLVATILHLLFVAMGSHHCKGDETVWYSCWNAAAHIWDCKKQIKTQH